MVTPTRVLCVHALAAEAAPRLWIPDTTLYYDTGASSKLSVLIGRDVPLPLLVVLGERLSCGGVFRQVELQSVNRPRCCVRADLREVDSLVLALLHPDSVLLWQHGVRAGHHLGALVTQVLLACLLIHSCTVKCALLGLVE